LIATWQRAIALPKPRIAQKRDALARHGTTGISTVFFCPFAKKSIEITRSRLLQFAARAIHCRTVEEKLSQGSKSHAIYGDIVMVQTQEHTDHVTVQNFFAGRGLLATRIPETAVKTPDFRILRGTETVAFCEVKSPQDVFTERLHAAICEAPSGQISGIIEEGRQYRCLARIMEGAKLSWRDRSVQVRPR
jgi:hypothetical protein